MTSSSIALVVIDMQNGFLNQKSEHVVDPVEKLVAACDSCGVDVVFTRFINRKGSAFERLIGWTRLRNSPEIDIHPTLRAYAKRVIDKEQYSAFTTEFDRLRASHRWDTLLLCGVATDGCVLKTAVDAFERGIRPVIVADACASHAGDEVHKAGLLLLGRFVGKNQIVDSSAALELLSSQTATRVSP